MVKIKTSGDLNTAEKITAIQERAGYMFAGTETSENGETVLLYSKEF